MKRFSLRQNTGSYIVVGPARQSFEVVSVRYQGEKNGNHFRRNLALGGMGLLVRAAATRSALLRRILSWRGRACDFRLASDAYVFGYPLVSMEMTRRAATLMLPNLWERALMG